MSGFPRDLAVLEPWELSAIRSRERRQRAARGRTRGAVVASTPRRARSRRCPRPLRPRQARASPHVFGDDDGRKQPDGHDARPGRGAAVGSVAGPLPRPPAGRRAALRAGRLARETHLDRRARGAHGRPGRVHRHRKRSAADRRLRPAPLTEEPGAGRAASETAVDAGLNRSGVSASRPAAAGPSDGDLRPGNRTRRGDADLQAPPRPDRRRDRQPGAWGVLELPTARNRLSRHPPSAATLAAAARRPTRERDRRHDTNSTRPMSHGGRHRAATHRARPKRRSPPTRSRGCSRRCTSPSTAPSARKPRALSAACRPATA